MAKMYLLLFILIHFCMKTEMFSYVFGFAFTLPHPKTELNEYANENGAGQKLTYL